MPEQNDLLKALLKQIPKPAVPKTSAQQSKDREAQADKGRKAFQETITGRKQSDAQYQAGKKASASRMVSEAQFRKKNNVSTDQSSELIKLRAQYPKELHGLIDSALYIRQKGITPISGGEPGKTWLDKPDIDYVKEAMKSPEGRAVLEREVRRFKAERGIMSAQYNSGEAKMQRDWSGQMLAGIERDNENITKFLGLDTPVVKAINDYALAVNPATGPLFGLGQMFPATKDMMGNLVKSTPSMVLTGGPQVVGDAGRLLFGVQNPEIAPIPALAQSGANLGMALVPELGPAAMRGISRVAQQQAMKQAEMAAVRAATANAALDKMAGRTINGFAVEGAPRPPFNQITQAVEAPVRPIMSQGPGLTVQTDSPDFLTRQEAKRAATEAEIARLEAARAQRMNPAVETPPATAQAPKVKTPRVQSKPGKMTLKPGEAPVEGIVITGTTPKGQKVKMFEQDPATAAQIKENIKAGNDPVQGTKYDNATATAVKPDPIYASKQADDQLFGMLKNKHGYSNEETQVIADALVKSKRIKRVSAEDLRWTSSDGKTISKQELDQILAKSKPVVTGEGAPISKAVEPPATAPEITTPKPVETPKAGIAPEPKPKVEKPKFVPDETLTKAEQAYQRQLTSTDKVKARNAKTILDLSKQTREKYGVGLGDRVRIEYPWGAVKEGELKADPKTGWRTDSGHVSLHEAKTITKIETPSLKESNAARIAELEAKPKSRGIKGKQTGGVNIHPEDIELAARKALHAVYTAGEHLHTQIIKIGKELGLNPKQRAKALEMAKEFDPELGKFHFEPKTASSPKAPKVEPVAEPSSREVVGFARQVSGREAMPGVSREQILKTGQEAISSGRIHPESVAERVLSSGKAANPEETAAMAVRVRELANEFDSVSKAIEKQPDKVELLKLSQRQDEILNAMESIDMAGRVTGNTWAKMGQALQIALKKDYSLASLLTRVKAYAGEVTGAHKSELLRLTKLVDEGNVKIDELKNQIAAMAASWKNKTPIAKAAKVLASYFGVSSEKAPLIAGGIRGKQAGKANYAIPKEEMAAMKAARSMAREAYHDEGITTLDGVLDFIRKESGATEATDEQLLRLLSEPYRAHMLEADIARRKIDQFMRDVKKQALEKQKPAMAKVMAGVRDTYDAVSRSLQAGGDMSAPFIQGRKGLFANPKSWIEAWGPAMKALWSKGDDVVERYMLDNVERHPMYARSVAAGLDLPEIGGKLTKQEEAFASNLIHVLKDKKLGGGQLYFKFLANTDAAYTVFLNKLRFDTFVKMAKAAPDNPEALRDFANAVNIIYGRGKEGWAVGAAKTDAARRAFFAPRYTVSKWQYANPVGLATNFKTPQGRAAMLKVYGAQAAAYTGLVAMARMAGWEVGVDPRSSDFGKVTLPNGFKVDLFGKEAEAYKLVSQIMYGKVAQSGGFTPKSMDNAGRTTVQYLANKTAPLPRDAMNVLFGKFDYNEGKSRPVQVKDFGMSKLPFWIQQAIDDGTFQSAPYFVPISAMGIDIQGPGKPKTKTPPPFNLLDFKLGPTESKPKSDQKKAKKKDDLDWVKNLAK